MFFGRHIIRFGFVVNNTFTKSIFCHKFVSINCRYFMMSSAPKPLVICGPSGSGKSTLLNKLMEEFKDSFKFSISHTTRKPRNGETDGKEYHFIEKQMFEKMIKQKLFIEFVEFTGNYYGTSKKSLEEVQKSGQIPVLDLELKGVQSLKKLEFKAIYVFIKPPNFETLERNLRNRGSESEEDLQKRLKRAVEDIKEVESNPSLFDQIIINDNLEVSYNQLKQFVQTDMEALKRQKSSQ